MLNNSYQTYKQQSILTMTPGDMLTKLYDEILKQLELSKQAFEKKDFAAVNQSLQKTQSILRHLRSTLDFKYEISNNLDALYDYFIYITIQANTKKDPKELDEVEGFISELRASYIQADRQTRVKEA